MTAGPSRDILQFDLQFDDWQRQFEERGEIPAIPAATVVVLRDGPTGVETLMLHKNSRVAFGGMWVFPGGRIDEGDRDETGDLVNTARNAAIREAHEEAAITVDPAALSYFSFWIPPPIAPKRYATWFFAARAGVEEVVIDDGEIVRHEWMAPADALRRRDDGDIELAPPTWVTLWTVDRFASVEAALDGLGRRHPRYYETHVAKGADGPVAMWAGDAGYETSDPALDGPRHRLSMASVGYQFDESGYRDPEPSNPPDDR